MRSIFEGLLCLAIAVILFRSFQLEGYMISTGSMAPCLLGYHKRVVCPNCHYQYAFGTAYDESLAAGGHASGHARPATELDLISVCPNCGQGSIDVGDVPRNQGDQLLVHKNAYALRPPRRWEVVVFRNPYRPTEAYVKRVVGLPGDALQIIEGDIYVNGRIERKDLDAQRSIRINVYDHDYQPEHDPQWRPRWTVDAADRGASWRTIDGGFAFYGARDADAQPAWVRYEHWLRYGGRHRTSVSLGERSPIPPVSDSVLYPAELDRRSRELSCRGALTTGWLDRVCLAARDPDFARAAAILHEQSHRAPILDAYGYNRAFPGIEHVPVRDVMLAMTLDLSGGNGEFLVELNDGRHRVQCVIDAGRSEVRLHVDGGSEPVRTAAISSDALTRPLRLEFSLMDRRALM
ncbi:MAG: signal peptidase I, partial [Planctomycetaceae bacterium]